MSKKFLYSNIEFIDDLTDPDSPTTRLGFFAEWYDGTFWRISLCSVLSLRPEKFETLDNKTKLFLENPFQLLFESSDRFFRRHPPVQEGHFLPSFLTKLFPSYLSVQATTLFDCKTSPEQTGDDIFEDLAIGLPKPAKEAHWYNLPLVDPTGIIEESDEQGP